MILKARERNTVSIYPDSWPGCFKTAERFEVVFRSDAFFALTDSMYLKSEGSLLTVVTRNLPEV